MQLNRLPSHSVSLLDTINIASIGVNNTNSAEYTRDSRSQKIISFGGEDLFWSIFEDTSDRRRQQRLWFEPNKSAGSRLSGKELSFSIRENPQAPSLTHRIIHTKELKHASWILRHYDPEYFFAVFSTVISSRSEFCCWNDFEETNELLLKRLNKFLLISLTRFLTQAADEN